MIKNSTLFLKGLAIILMITHHLFWNHPGYGIMIDGVALSQRIGYLGKLCVALFLMLSGYGLFKKYGMEYKYADQRKRITSLYLVYWICIAFVIILGLFFFRNKFFELFAGISFKDNIKNSVLTLFGLQQFTGYQGFIGAWWFVSLILTCYLLFPIFIKNKKREDIMTLMVLCLFSYLFYYDQGFKYILAYILPFFLGIIICKYNLLEKYKNKYLACVFLFLFIILRMNILGLTKIGYVMELLICALLIYIFQSVKTNVCTKPFIYIGKKSGYIFYIHMIFANYFCDDYIKLLKEPIVMIGAVLLLSLLCSIVLERIEFFIVRKLEKVNNIVNNKI